MSAPASWIENRWIHFDKRTSKRKQDTSYIDYGSCVANLYDHLPIGGDLAAKLAHENAPAELA